MKTIMDPVEEEDLKFLLEDLSDATFGDKASVLEDSELGKDQGELVKRNQLAVILMKKVRRMFRKFNLD